MNLVCSICTELLSASADILSTPCGHLFHNQCVHQWLVRSKSCPQCRFAFAPRNLHKIYLNVGSSDASFTETSVLQLQHINDGLKSEISQNMQKIKELESKLATEQVSKVKMTQKYHIAQEKFRSSQLVLADTLRDQLHLLDRENDRYDEVQEKLNKAKRELVSSEGKRKEISSYLENSRNECKKKEEQIRNLRKAFEQMKEKNKHLNVEVVNSRINAANTIDENAVFPALLKLQRVRTRKRSNTTGSICDSRTTHNPVGLVPLQPRGLSNQAPAKSKPLQIFKRPSLTYLNNMRRASALGDIGLIGFGSSERCPFNMNIDVPKKKLKGSARKNSDS